ncbi:MAG: hypothetical protein LBV79_00940 [Candidatus Adiutrix sp.]|jgi:hypothetical protein|nr:hypothetical protein [Candidatus Adiutrix sp.]
MKNVFLCLVALAATCLFSGCGAGSAYRNNVNSWVGAPVQEMAAKWGNLDALRTLPGGGKEYLAVNATPPLWNEP